MHEHSYFRIALLLLVVLVCPVAQHIVEAQSRPIGGPFNEVRPLDPNRISQDLTLTMDVSSGYDFNSEPLDTQTPQSGYVTTVLAALRHRWGRAARNVESSGQAYVSHATVGVNQLKGATATVQGATDLGRRNGVTGSVLAAYEPMFLFDAFRVSVGPGETGAMPDVNPTQGITEQTWMAAHGSASLFRNWTSRQRMDIQYRSSQRHPTSGAGFASRSQLVSVLHDWNVRQNVGFQFSYRYDTHRQNDESGIGQPLRYQTAEIRMRLVRRVSPSRHLTASVGSGATHSWSQASTDDPPFEFVVPTVSASVRLELSRLWALAANINREVTVLDGITPEPFAADVASLRAEGIFASGLQIAVSGDYSRGESRTTRSGSFESAAGTVELQYSVTRYLGLSTRYAYYAHRLRGVSVLPEGFPTRYRRHLVLLGLTISLPLYHSL
jgi:hypothetical protein